MTNRFEDLWATAANDGAACPCGVDSSRSEGEEELQLLMDAWYREREGHIECSLALEQAGRMIASLLAEADVSPSRRRRARRLIRTILTLRDETRF